MEDLVSVAFKNFQDFYFYNPFKGNWVWEEEVYRNICFFKKKKIKHKPV